MNEQDEILLLEFVEGELTGPELERAKALLAGDAALAARVEAMRQDRVGLRALGEVTAKVGAGAGATAALPDAVRAALEKWDGKSGGASTGGDGAGSDTAGFVGPGTPGEELPSENHVWRPKSTRRPAWRVELFVAYGGIAAMVIIGAFAVLSPDAERQTSPTRMPSLSKVEHDSELKESADLISPAQPARMMRKQNESAKESASAAAEGEHPKNAGAEPTLRTADAAGKSRGDLAEINPQRTGDKLSAPAAAPVVSAVPMSPAAAVPAGSAVRPAESTFSDRSNVAVESAAGARGKEKIAASGGKLDAVTEAPMGVAVGDESKKIVTDADRMAVGREPSTPASPARMAAAADRASARAEANARAQMASGAAAFDSVPVVKRDVPNESAEVLVEAASIDSAMKIVSDWAKMRHVAIESSSRRGDGKAMAMAAAKAAPEAKQEPGVSAASGPAPMPTLKPLDPNAERVTMLVTPAELAELLMQLRGARVAAKLEAAPPAVQSYVSAALARPALSFSIAELEEGAGSQKRDMDTKKMADADASKTKDTAVTQPAKPATQPLGKNGETQVVRAIITVREPKRK